MTSGRFGATGAVFLMLAAGGCTATTFEDAAPRVGPAPAPPPLPGEERVVQRGPGEFPNLNIPQTPATAQLTPEEGAASAEALRTRRQASQGRGDGGARDDSAALRSLAGDHADAALRRIEGR